jgi:hypothetical protein
MARRLLWFVAEHAVDPRWSEQTNDRWCRYILDFPWDDRRTPLQTPPDTLHD